MGPGCVHFLLRFFCLLLFGARVLQLLLQRPQPLRRLSREDPGDQQTKKRENNNRLFLVKTLQPNALVEEIAPWRCMSRKTAKLCVDRPVLEWFAEVRVRALLPFGLQMTSPG